MDARKGIKRLSVFVAGLYFAFWAGVAYISSGNVDYALEKLKIHPYGDPENNFWMLYMNDSGWWVQKSVEFGLYPAISLTVLSPIIFWVYRGFFPKNLTK